FNTDPVGDLAANPVPGLIHKYRGRVLLITTGACAIHCRYCFRRHYPYGEGCAGQSELAAVLAHIAADSTISEVILSGGDPLSLTNNRLLDLLSRLDRIPHIQRLRIHTRLPVVLPERIDDNLLNGLADPADRLVVVLHINHANEIDPTVAAKLGELRRLGITLLNQAVLLSGINDDLTALKTLSERLFSVGVLPYYLHQLDRVQGAHHFHVEKDAAMALMAALRRELPGYLLPRLVEEISGADAKRPLFY
ncbi:MAG: KamA family radical SAM protein, partial [Gammaproteobacteria bacterium]|nr:KamA family radical SAM protein [Gammaproteobacteria bacterium]